MYSKCQLHGLVVDWVEYLPGSLAINYMHRTPVLNFNLATWFSYMPPFRISSIAFAWRIPNKKVGQVAKR